MSILSFEFMIFMLVAFVLYYLLPVRFRWFVLFLGSTLFIMSAGLWSMFHLTCIAFIVWRGSYLVERRKKALVPLLTLIFASLFFVKYAANLIWNNVSVLGLSYFTFQAAGLLIDVYCGKIPVQKNPLKVWMFLGYFPQMVQGPISTWRDIGENVCTGHSFEEEKFVSGFILVLWGYFKKLVIADRIAKVTVLLYDRDYSLPGWLIVFLVILYSIRLYTDFSGGMDVVRGVSRMFGIELPENFARPFFSESIAQYWRRWHITLGAWFRSYLLFPLATSSLGLTIGKTASKKFGKKIGSIIPTALATLLVFLAIGIWHNFSANALIYGLYFGILMSISMLMEPFRKKKNKKNKSKDWKNRKSVRMLRTWLLLLPAQYFTFTTDPGLSFKLMKNSIFHFFSDSKVNLAAFLSIRQWAILYASMLILLIVDIVHERKGDLSVTLQRSRLFIRWGLMLLLIIGVVVFGIYGDGLDTTEFLYTTF